MRLIKLTFSFIIRQILGLVVGALVMFGTLLGAGLAGALVVVTVLVLGTIISILVALGPLIGLTSVGVLEKTIEKFEKATADLKRTQNDDKVTPLYRP